MKKIEGKVLKVFIPENDNTNIYNSNKIGFQVETTEGIKEIIQFQNEKNINKERILLVQKEQLEQAKVILAYNLLLIITKAKEYI